jgi:hypothetical protein
MVDRQRCTPAHAVRQLARRTRRGGPAGGLGQHAVVSHQAVDRRIFKAPAEQQGPRATNPTLRRRTRRAGDQRPRGLHTAGHRANATPLLLPVPGRIALKKSWGLPKKFFFSIGTTTRSTMTIRTAKIITISLAVAALTGCVATMPGATVGQRDAITPESLGKMKVPRLSGASVLLGYVSEKLREPGVDDERFVELMTRIGPQLEREISALRAAGRDANSKQNKEVAEKYRRLIAQDVSGEVYEYFTVELGQIATSGMIRGTGQMAVNATYDAARGAYVWEGEIGKYMYNNMPKPPNFKEYEGYIGDVDVQRKKVRVVVPVTPAERSQDLYVSTQKGVAITKSYRVLVHYKPANCVIKDIPAKPDVLQCSLAMLGSAVFEPRPHGERGRALSNARVELM